MSSRRAAGVGRSAAVNAAGSLLNGALSALVIAVAARQGQTGEIAAFTVMTALQALVTGAIAGGSSLLYMTGDDASRSQVRRHRLVVVVPVILVAGLAGTAFYSSRSYSVLPLLAVAVVSLLNNLAELHYGDLRREFRFTASVMAALVSKAFATILVLLSIRLSLALLVAAVLQLMLLEALAGRESWLRLGSRAIRGPTGGRLSLRPGLMLFSYATLYTARISVLVLSLVVPRDVVGEYGVVLAAYLAVGGVLHSGLQVVLATRVRRRRGLEPSQASDSGLLEALILGISVLVSIGLIAVSHPLVTNILNLRTEGAASWLILLSLALPAFVGNRIAMLYNIADDKHQSATRIALWIAAALTLVLAIGGLSLTVTGAATATLVAEGGVAIALLARRTYRRSRTRR